MTFQEKDRQFSVGEPPVEDYIDRIGQHEMFLCMSRVGTDGALKDNPDFQGEAALAAFHDLALSLPLENANFPKNYIEITGIREPHHVALVINGLLIGVPKSAKISSAEYALYEKALKALLLIIDNQVLMHVEPALIDNFEQVPIVTEAILATYESAIRDISLGATAHGDSLKILKLSPR